MLLITEDKAPKTTPGTGPQIAPIIIVPITSRYIGSLSALAI